METKNLQDVEFGEELPAYVPDTTLKRSAEFASIVGWEGARFSDHEKARKEGLAGAMVPGILNQAYFSAMIHKWAPNATLLSIDTIFRAPVIADQAYTMQATVTHIDENAGIIEIDLIMSNEKKETRVLGTARISL
jgi:acyl dehydratase